MANPSDENPSTVDSGTVQAAAAIAEAPAPEAMAIALAPRDVLAVPTRPSRPAILNAAPKPIDLLRALQRRWLLALVLSAALAIPAALIAYFTVAVNYQATSWLSVRGGTVMFSVKKAQSSLQTHSQLIRSFFVLNAALAQPEIAELPYIKAEDKAGRDPVEWLGQRLNVVVPRGGRGGSSIMKIGMAGDDPQQVQKLVKAVTKAYLDRVVNEERKNLLKRRDLLEQLYHRKSEEIRKRREDIHDLARRAGTGDADIAAAQQRLVLDHLIYLRRQTQGLRQRIISARRRLQLFVEKTNWNKDRGKIPPQMVEQFVNSDNDLRRLQAGLEQKQQELAEIVKIVRDPKNSRQVAGKNREIQEIKKAADARYDAVYAEILRKIKSGELKTKLQAQYDKLTENVELLERYYKESESQYVLLTKQIEKLGGYSADLARRREDIQHTQKATKAIGYELEQLQIELEAGGKRITMLEDARLPRNPNTNKRDKWTALAGLAGCALALVGISLFEFHARRITRSEEMVDGLGINVLGTVPMLTGRRWRFSRNGTSAAELQAVMDESVDGIRAMLLHSPDGPSIRTLLITSARAGEGKTTVASSLAASLGRSGRRTLLIDGDLRSPSVHRLLEMPLDSGFAEVLRGEAAVEEVIHPSRASGLWVMTAGRCDQVSLQALTKEGLGQLFEKLRSEFDFVIVDSGPILAVVDPLLLGQHCDCALFSVVRRISQISAVYEALERMKTIGVKVVGCVVNGATSNLFGAGYYGYAYGYGYGNGHATLEPDDVEVESES